MRSVSQNPIDGSASIEQTVKTQTFVDKNWTTLRPDKHETLFLNTTLVAYFSNRE